MRFKPKNQQIEALRSTKHDVVLTKTGYHPVFEGDWICITKDDHRFILSDHDFRALFTKDVDDTTPIVRHNSQHGAKPGIAPEFITDGDVAGETDRPDGGLPPCDPTR